MYRARAKICGIKSREIAEVAVENGVDALGFVFYDKSPRNISVSDAAAIISSLPSFVGKTGVFVGNDIGFIRDVAEKTGINAVQLHGDESVMSTRFIKELKGQIDLPLVLTLRTNELNDEFLKGAMASDHTMKNWISGYLVDRYDINEFGGTGKTVSLDTGLVTGTPAGEFIRQRIILAGGINAANLNGILDNIRPFGVDVSSGVESSKGVKDRGMVKEFLEKLSLWNAAAARG